jgi:hypothetical protein
MTLTKRVAGAATLTSEPDWLPVEALALVEVSSEDPDHPIEAALLDGGGWRAAAPGPQWIRLVFDAPQRIALVHLTFEETDVERAQEFTLQCSAGGAPTPPTLIRQHYAFSPSGATREVENYSHGLDAVTELELYIVPEISRVPRIASLARFRVR